MKKDILLVINTLGRAGAETALVALIKKLDPEKYNIYLYVCLGQGELIRDIPDYVTVLNKDYDESSVLTADGKKQLKARVFKMLFTRGAAFRNIPYIISNAVHNLMEHRKVSVDKLLWSVVADAGASYAAGRHYDLAVAYIEGAAAYFVDRYVNADKKAGFIHVDYGMAGYSRRLDRECYDRFDKVFTVSDEVKDSFLKVYPECKEKTEVFHNLIDIDLVKSKAQMLVPDDIDTDSQKIKILTVCRLTKQKALEVSIGAMKILKDKGINAVWYVVGDGPERDRLSDLIKQYDVTDRFILLGSRDNPYPYYKACDIYVHATKYEGKSIAIQEAQIIGLPIIASDCSGNREQIIDGVDGILCEFSENGIADAVTDMIENRQNWDGYCKNASKKVCDNSSELNRLYELL